MLQVFPLKDPNIWFDYDVVYEWLSDLFSPGAVSGDVQVQPQSPATLGVQVTAGRAYVQYGPGDVRCVKNSALSKSGATNPDWANNFTAPAAQPRVDRVVFLVTDESQDDPVGSGKKGQFKVIAGTPTAGADLTNLSGAAAIPSNTTLLANVLVSGSTISSAGIDTKVRRDTKIGLGAVAVSSLISHTEHTSDVHITATTDGTANEIVTAPAITVDGLTTYLLHCYVPLVDWTSGTDLEAIFVLYIDSTPGPEIGRQRMSSATGAENGINLWKRWVPTAGTKAFGVRGFLSGSGDAYTRAGPGLIPGDKSPIFLRLLKD
jgi:hypothetical protein